jgi:4-oxalocrotonate tautomerase
MSAVALPVPAAAAPIEDSIAGGMDMPVVTVQMWPGRTRTQKRALVRAITDAMVQHAGAKPDNLHVILQEVPREDWALAGVMGDERKD